MILTVRDFITLVNLDPKILDYKITLQMPAGSSCMSYDIDSLEQIAVSRDREEVVLIPDFCLDTSEESRAANSILNKPAIDSGSYWNIYEINESYYDKRKNWHEEEKKSA